MTGLFETVSIKSMSLRNRFVRSATWEGLADKEGAVTPKLTELMVRLARGEVGLIISGYAFVTPEGQSSLGQLAVHDDRFWPGLRQMAAAVHEAGGRIALQIVHGGLFASSELTARETNRPFGRQKVRPRDEPRGDRGHKPGLHPDGGARQGGGLRCDSNSRRPWVSFSASSSHRPSTNAPTNSAAALKTAPRFLLGDGAQHPPGRGAGVSAADQAQFRGFSGRRNDTEESLEARPCWKRHR